MRLVAEADEHLRREWLVQSFGDEGERKPILKVVIVVTRQILVWRVTDGAESSGDAL